MLGSCCLRGVRVDGCSSVFRFGRGGDERCRPRRWLPPFEVSGEPGASLPCHLLLTVPCQWRVDDAVYDGSVRVGLASWLGQLA